MATDFNIPGSLKGFVDLRSDTVTRPTAAMYEAIMKAALGDDVLGDEPTVAELERLACERTGKEAAVFVPSGTMSNQIAVPSWTERGDAVLFEEEAHMLYYECGGPAVHGQVVTWTLPSKLGVMAPDDVERHITKRSLHTPGVRLICLENTHNRAGGTIVPLDAMKAYREIANRHGIPIHLDGARLFNAAVAISEERKAKGERRSDSGPKTLNPQALTLDHPSASFGLRPCEVSREICSQVDSVSICLSKGLSSPVGSVLCGPTEFIGKARQWRKRLGGGMRQAGILAACGIVSLTKMICRLAEDHERARKMAAALSDMPGVNVDWDRVQTNMVLANVDDGAAWMNDLKEFGVLALPPAPDRLRLVFHADIDDDKLQKAINGFSEVAERRAGVGV
jgi:threonine aldolase